MISTPRMICYERFMRQAEFSQLSFIPKALDMLYSNYDWNLHKTQGREMMIRLTNIREHLKSNKIGYIGEKSAYGMNDYEFNLNTNHLPVAFVVNKTMHNAMTLLAELFAVNQLQFYFDEWSNSKKSNNGYILEKEDYNDILKNTFNDTDNFLNKWIRILYAFHMFRQEMNNIVLIERNLLIELGQTEFPTSTEYLKSPFRSFYLMFEPGSIYTPVELISGSSNFEKSLVDYEGAFINIENDVEKSGYTAIRIDLHVRITKKNAHLFSSLDPVTTYWELLIPKGKDMTEGINESIENIRQNYSADTSTISWKKNEDQIRHFTNTVIQVLLYMTSINRESVLIERESKPIDKNRVKKYIEREETQMNYNVLGSSRTNFINGGTYYSKKDGTKRTGKKLGHKTIVRGHWHSFWYKNEAKISEIPTFMHREEKYDDMGKKMIRCIKWVAPYSKGQGEEIVKEYKLTSGGRKLKETA